MNARDKKKMNRATELAADAIHAVVNAYVEVLETLINNELKKQTHLPPSLQDSPVGMDLRYSIDFLENKINDAESILFSKVMELSGKGDTIDF